MWNETLFNERFIILHNHVRFHLRGEMKIHFKSFIKKLVAFSLL